MIQLEAKASRRAPRDDGSRSNPGIELTEAYSFLPSFRTAARAVALFPATTLTAWRAHFATRSLGFETEAEATPESRLPRLFADPLAAILATWLVEVQRTPAKASRALIEYARRAAQALERPQQVLELETVTPPTPLELRRATLGLVAEVGGADPADVLETGVARWLSGITIAGVTLESPTGIIPPTAKETVMPATTEASQTTTGDIEITEDRGRIWVESPYHPDFVEGARRLSGKFNRMSGWSFDSRDATRVRDLLYRVFGTDGTPVPATDVMMEWGGDTTTELWDMGRQLLRRRGRDDDIELGEGVVVIEGDLPPTGGSRKYPELGIPRQIVILEVRDVPRTLADAAVAASPGKHRVGFTDYSYGTR